MYFYKDTGEDDKQKIQYISNDIILTNYTYVTTKSSKPIVKDNIKDKKNKCNYYNTNLTKIVNV
jgi:hypothetical protein